MASRAIHRLMRDLEEIKNEPLATVAALPEPNDIFSWHMNLRPCDGPFADSVFHFTIKFPHDYPHSPPENVLLLSTDMPGHPNVFGSYICLDMLKDYTSTMRYGGWTTAYSCMSLALQLQSFLFAERVDQDYGGSQTTHWMPQTIARVRESNRTFTMRIDGDHMHTHDAPWPPFAVSSPPHPVASSVSNLTQLIERVTVSPPSSPHRRPRRGEQQEAKHVDSSPALVLTADDAPPVQLTDLAPDELVMITDHLRTEDLLAFTRTCTTFRSVDRSFSLFARRQLCCFHTKARYGSEPDLILGVGLSLKHHTDNNLKEVDTPFDVLSEAAFVTDGVRLSVWKLPFTTFLPLAIDEGHFDRAVPALHRAAQAAFGEGARTIEILELLATAMNSMVVKLFSLHTDTRRPPPLHASEAALDAYCGFHHLLLCAAHRWPAIRVEAQRRVTAFLADGDGRSKSNTPDLGRLLIALTLSAPGWEQLCYPFLREMLVRGVRWVLMKKSALEVISGPHEPTATQRAEQTFEAQLTSLRLVSFQVAFLRLVGRPAGTTGPDDVRAGYTRRLGKPTDEQRAQLQSTAKRVLALSGWAEFFQLVGAAVPEPPKLHELLCGAVQTSAAKGYHGSSQARASGGQRGRGGRARAARGRGR